MPSDGLTFDIYDPTNQTKIGTLASVVKASMSDEFNSTGAGTLTVPFGSADAALLVKDAVVRVNYQGTTRFAWFIEVVERELANSSGQQLLTVSGRGLLAWLADAIVYGQGGYMGDFVSTDRPFNFAANNADAKSTVTWSAPQALLWKSDATARAGLPVGWKDPDSSYWIWATNPSTSVQRGTYNYFYKSFTLSASTKITFIATFDNSGEVWLDGSKVMDSTRFTDQAPSFAQTVRFTARLGKGTHVIAARVRNEKPWQRDDLSVSSSTSKVSASGHGLADDTAVVVVALANKKGETGGGLTLGNTYYVRNSTTDDFKLATSAGGTAITITKDLTISLRLKADSTAGFLLTAFEANDSGKLTTNNIVRTNTTWEVATDTPKWYPALILSVLLGEAKARGVYRLGNVVPDFTWSAPTAGSWSTSVEATIKVGTSLLDVLSQMVDYGHDFWIHPTTLKLRAWETRGSDVSSTVTLALKSNLLQYTTRAEPKLKTTALIRTKEGWTWTQSPNISDYGRREMYLEYGNTRDDSTAKNAALRVLRRTGKAKVTVQAEAIVVSGAAPYVNFNVGDVVKVTDTDGVGTTTARVLSIGIEHDGQNIRFTPELEML